MRTHLAKDYQLVVPEIRGTRGTITFPCFGDVKKDGEFNYARIEGGETELINKPKYGRHRFDMPINDELSRLPISRALIVGELCQGQGTSVYDFLRAKLSDELRFFAFDIWELDGEDLRNCPQHERRQILSGLIKPSEYVEVINSKILQSIEELQSWFLETIAEGNEGLVVKNYNSVITRKMTSWAKVKKKACADLVVLGFTKKAKHLSMCLGIIEPDGTERVITNCGNGISMLDKETWRRKLGEDIVGQDNHNFYVKPKYVCEIEHQGVINTAEGELSSLRMPVFRCWRPDKGIEDTNIERDTFLAWC